MISGTFEIHITVNAENDYTRLWSFARLHKCKLILAAASNGIFPNQYMISKWVHKSSLDDAVTKAKEYAAIMIKDFQIKVERVKVEAIANAQGVPVTDEEYATISNYLCDKYNNNTTPYFEFHMKVEPKNDETFADMKANCENIGAAISINMCSAKKIPLVTLRYYGIGRENAETNLTSFKDKLVKMGYTEPDSIQKEFSCYDDNVSIDKDWIL
jgi:hypothetical protein